MSAALAFPDYQKIESTASRLARESEVRQKFQRRTAAQEGWINRLGFHSIVSNYTGGNRVNRLSGSSINRKMVEREKIERGEPACRGKAHAIIAVGRSVRESTELPAWVCPGLLSQEEVNRIRIIEQVPDGDGGNVQRLHVLSQRSKGVVRARFTAFYRACAGRKTFCTLTFINDVTDSDAVKILNKFFTVLRKQFPHLLYIWVAERQLETTNRIHFHIVMNIFLPIKKFNALWVLQQYNAGIVHPKFTREQVLEFDKVESMKTILNPVDVRAIKNLSQLSGYLTKYITKGNNKGEFGCAVWHCSREVSQLFLRTIVDWECVQLAKSDENARFNRATGEYYGPPTWTAGRTGKNGGFLYMVYHLNQPQRFLGYLREMEQINKWIISGAVDPGQVMEYLNGIPFPENLYCLN